MTTNMPSLHGLTRHYYEARREVLAHAGIPATPWYQLTAEERQIAQAEADIVREALRRAAAEQEAIDTHFRRPARDLAGQPEVTIWFANALAAAKV
ncbi:hypothetical protein ACGFYQ_33940 [Streptomyces sp. NPDC048258]|uniref:hypothetical protein n=1 Tax=Streptomyces sp. NPDC048258 TaxID=3365527 RepID=UPI0037119F89